MTKAHIGSRLNLKNMVHSLPEGMILFPLDGRVYDTKNQIPVLLNTTTIRNDEKKFFTSIAVEDGTTNNIANRDFEQNNPYSNNSATGEYSYRIDPYYGKVMKLKKTDGGTGRFGMQFPLTGMSGNLYSASVYVRSLSSTGRFALYVDAQSNATLMTSSTYKHLSTLPYGEWVRVSLICNDQTTETLTGGGYAYVWIDNENGECEVSMIQVECKDHITSFVDGTRSVGNLKYDISSLGMRDAGCVSCWIYNSDSMVNNRATGGTVNNQYLIKLGSYKNNDWYADCISAWIPNNTPRSFALRTDLGMGNGWSAKSSRLVSDFGLGNWLHFVVQWDKNGLPSGNQVEMYINGQLEVYQTTSTTLPVNVLTYLHLGAWSDNDDGLKPCTMFEQLAIHPSKGFSPEVIQNWYESQTPFFDVHDQMFVY